MYVTCLSVIKSGNSVRFIDDERLLDFTGASVAGAVGGIGWVGHIGTSRCGLGSFVGDAIVVNGDSGSDSEDRDWFLLADGDVDANDITSSGWCGDVVFFGLFFGDEINRDFVNGSWSIFGSILSIVQSPDTLSTSRS